MAYSGLDLSHRNAGIEHIGNGFVPDVVNPCVFNACCFTASLPGRPHRMVRHSIGLCEHIRSHYLGKSSFDPDPVEKAKERVRNPDQVGDPLIFRCLGKGDGSFLKIHLAPLEIKDPAASLARIVEGIDDVGEVGGFFPEQGDLSDCLELLVGDVPLPARLLKTLDSNAGVFIHQTPADRFPEGIADEGDLPVDRGSRNRRFSPIHIFVDILDGDRIDPGITKKLQRVTGVGPVGPG